MKIRKLLVIIWILHGGLGQVYGQTTFEGSKPHSGQIEFLNGTQIPSSTQRIHNDTSIIRFAIMGDRTGGMLSGVFERGVEKVNLLQPEFVISVGDLIDGYTTDPDVWNAQWEEFDAIIDGLDTRFFYVPGNHDISNELLLEEWKKRRGEPYYHFVYKNVLFLILHTEDGPGVTAGISEAQQAYIHNVLESFQDVRWTFVFKHRPLWHYDDQLGYESIEQALSGRNYTLFSGHHHHYYHTRQQSMKHYILGTTGGGSHLRGWEFGEFEHITWVTLPVEGEPVVAHLELDGIHDESIVTDKNYSLVQALRLGRWADIPAIFSKARNPTYVEVPVTITNSEASPLLVTSDFEPFENIRFVPETLSVVIPPQRDTTVMVRIEPVQSIDLHTLNESGINLSFKATYVTDKGNLSLPNSKRLTFDWEHTLPRSKQLHRIDGDLQEWEDSLFTTIRNPVYTHEDWDWKGPEDGWFRFALAESSDSLLVAIEAHDDRLLGLNSDSLVAHQDQFFIHLDGTGNSRNPDIPDRLYGSDWVDPSYFLQLRVAPGRNPGEALVQSNTPDLQISAGATVDETDGIIRVEVAIPLSYLSQGNSTSSSFRFNVGWMDHDRPENTKPSILWWRPVWGKSVDFERSATFRK
jgi:hypothetical protein